MMSALELQPRSVTPRRVAWSSQSEATVQEIAVWNNQNWDQSINFWIFYKRSILFTFSNVLKVENSKPSEQDMGRICIPIVRQFFSLKGGVLSIIGFCVVNLFLNLRYTKLVHQKFSLRVLFSLSVKAPTGARDYNKALLVIIQYTVKWHFLRLGVQ